MTNSPATPDDDGDLLVLLLDMHLFYERVEVATDAREAVQPNKLLEQVSAGSSAALACE